MKTCTTSYDLEIESTVYYDELGMGIYTTTGNKSMLQNAINTDKDAGAIQMMNEFITKIMKVDNSVNEINREISDEEVFDIGNGGVLDISEDVIEQEELTHLRGIGVTPPY
ncbi:hypothetical protein [Parasitella parasitica]|uniref:Uncharacterized protein n=1 Tax=Parasitella parasitica TaxID=35722 RepID=A0A0B7NLW1_9FUNG|nr:hypothetical protein [Parasitella parasitica]